MVRRRVFWFGGKRAEFPTMMEQRMTMRLRSKSSLGSNSAEGLLSMCERPFTCTPMSFGAPMLS